MNNFNRFLTTFLIANSMNSKGKKNIVDDVINFVMTILYLLFSIAAIIFLFIMLLAIIF